MRIPLFLAFLAVSCSFTVTVTLAADVKRYETALTPMVETTLSSRIAGYVKAINATEGQYFDKNSTLVSIDCDIHKADLQRTEAELSGAREIYEARKKLDDLKSISKLDVRLSSVDVEKLTAEKKLKQKMVENCLIKAPFTGIVTEMIAKPFQNVNEGEPLLRIMDTTKVQLEFFVPSSDAARFTSDLPLNLYLNETGKTYKATLVSIVPRIDPVSQTFKAIGRINNPDKSMLPGMSGYITIPGDEGAAMPEVSQKTTVPSEMPKENNPQPQE